MTNSKVKDFPIDIFPDIKSVTFDKAKKKNISEDFVVENFERKGWNTYVPFVDTGIDLIITKTIDGKLVTRFIQIKTRALVDNVFGYTLKPKDFRDDPRHIFLFYCDSTNDFLIFPMNDYLSFFTKYKNLGNSHFAAKSFRVENNKINSLKYNVDKDEFSFTIHSFEKYRNENGLSLIDTTYIEKNFTKLLEENRQYKLDLFYSFNEAWLGTKLKAGDSEDIKNKKIKIKESIEAKLLQIKSENQEERNEKFKKIEKKFKENYPELYESHKKYIY